MKYLLLLCTALSAFAQSFGTYANPTNGAPVAHTSWLRSGMTNGNALGDPSLILYMPLSSPADKAYDYSGNGLTSAISGGNPAVVQYPFLHFLGCGASSVCPQLGSRGPYFFNSAVNTITTPSITLPSAFTFNIWVNPNGAFTNSYLRILETLYSSGFFLGIDSTKTHWQILINTSTLTNCVSTATIATGAWLNDWVMLTVTYGSGNAALFINGAAATMTGSCAYSAPSAPTQALHIGCGNGSCNSSLAWNGGLQGLRLYSRVLTSAEIAAIYAAESTPH